MTTPDLDDMDHFERLQACRDMVPEECVALYDQMAYRENVSPRSAAAGIEYAHSIATGRSATQAQLAAKYGTSAVTVRTWWCYVAENHSDYFADVDGAKPGRITNFRETFARGDVRAE